MLVKIILSVLYALFAGLGLWILRPFRNAAPFFWFTIAQAVMAIGTFAIIDVTDVDHIYYSVLFFIALFLFVAASAVTLQVRGVVGDLAAFSSKPDAEEHQDVKVFTFVMFVFCILITFIYYQSVGYNIIVQLLLGGGVEDYSTARIAAYSGDQYFAPGYVNQFKNVLLPATAAALAVWLWKSRNRPLFYGFCALAVPIVFVSLAGTGQRGYLFYTTAALFCAYVLHSTGRAGIDLRKVALYASPVALAFVLMTAAYYGREDQNALGLIGDTLMRFTTIQQDSGLVGFDLVVTLEPQWFTDWLKALLGVLPGFEGSMISHDVYAIMYGTTRGTAPLSSIGSAYYNAGFFGVVILFVLLGYFYVLAYQMYLRGARTILRSVSYGFIFLYMSLYLIDTPVSLIDNGVLAVGLFLVIANMLQSRRVQAAGSAASAG